MLLYLSGLQDISPDLYEAAAIDGASKRQQLFSITLPLLKPTTWLVILLQMIACIKVYGQISLITGGGPASSTRPLVQYVYETAFKRSDMGYAGPPSPMCCSPSCWSCRWSSRRCREGGTSNEKENRRLLGAERRLHPDRVCLYRPDPVGTGRVLPASGQTDLLGHRLVSRRPIRWKTTRTSSSIPACPPGCSTASSSP